MYQKSVAQQDRVAGDHEAKTFRTSAAAPIGCRDVPMLDVHATPKVRGQKNETDSWAQIAALKALRDAEGKFCIVVHFCSN